MFQNMGPAPSGRSGHAMATAGSRVYVLGGESFSSTKPDDPGIVHVLDTSTFQSFDMPEIRRAYSVFSTQVILSTRIQIAHSHRVANPLGGGRLPAMRMPLKVYRRGPLRRTSPHQRTGAARCPRLSGDQTPRICGVKPHHHLTPG